MVAPPETIPVEENPSTLGVWWLAGWLAGWCGDADVA